MNGCIAYPCATPRIKGSGFCAEHKTAHRESAWVAAWVAYQEECKRHGVKQTIFIAPLRK